MGTGESQEWGLSGRVQCVGLMSWVNTRPLICLAPSARSAYVREARFYGEFIFIDVFIVTIKLISEHKYPCICAANHILSK